jgi:hypothetical protein
MMSGGVLGGQPIGMCKRAKEGSHIGRKGTTERLIGIDC